MTACASTHATSTLPEPGVYAPAEVVQPYVPSGDPVDTSSTSTLTLEHMVTRALGDHMRRREYFECRAALQWKRQTVMLLR